MSFISAHIAATGVQAGDQAMQVAADNLANQLSDAFKRVDGVFQNTIYQDITGSFGGPQGNRQNIGIPPLQSGTGVRMAGIMRDFRPGISEATKNKFDVYIAGEGFLQVDIGNDTTAYTRMGHLKVDSSGTLRTLTDYPLTDNIQIDLTKYKDFNITRDGKVVGVDLTDNYTELGQITLWTFVNPAGLEAKEDTLFTWLPEAGQEVQGNPNDPGFGHLMQGYIERSNVNAPKELVNAVIAQRYSNANATLLRMAQDMEKVNISQIAQIA